MTIRAQDENSMNKVAPNLTVALTMRPLSEMRLRDAPRALAHLKRLLEALDAAVRPTADEDRAVDNLM